jgi:hypothetical protein
MSTIIIKHTQTRSNAVSLARRSRGEAYTVDKAFSNRVGSTNDLCVYKAAL